MERKITIRRVGTIFPALCLLVIVLVGGIIAWLSMVGLPGFVLRKIEQQAAPYGISLHVDSIKLSPASGLAAKALGVRLAIPAPGGELEIKAGKIQLAFSIYDLLQGNYLPDSINLSGVEAALPTDSTGQRTLRLQKSDSHLSLYNRGQGLSITSTGCLQGIGIKFKGNFQLPQNPATRADLVHYSPDTASTPSAICLDEFLLPIQPWLVKIDNIISQQQWTDDQLPQIEIKFRNHNQHTTAEIKAEVPSFRQEELHFHQASLGVRYEDETLTIDHLSFATKAPRTEVSLQGAYDLTKRQLSFNLRSSAAIAQIVEMIDRSQKNSILTRLYPNAAITPSVRLQGQIVFADDYALNNISLRGSILQREFAIGQTPIDAFELSFMLSDGKFNIDNLSLSLPDGAIKMTALTGHDKADASLHASLPFRTLTQLIGDISGTPLQLPESLNISGNLTLHANTLLSVKEFSPGITRMEDLIPTLKEIQNLDICVDSLRYGSAVLTAPQLHVSAASIQHPTLSSDLLDIRNIHCALSAKKLNVHDDFSLSDTRLKLSLESLSANCTQAEKSLRITGANVALDMTQATARVLSAHNVTCRIHNIPTFTQDKSWAEMLTKSDTHISAQNIQYQEQEIGSNINLSILHPELYAAELILGMNLQGEEIASSLKLDYKHTEQDGNLNFNFAETSLPLASAAPLLQQFGAIPTAVELPEKLILQTHGSVNVNTGQLNNTHLYLHIPKLVRTPHTITVNNGKKIPLELTLQTNLQSTPDNDIRYQGKITILHETGAFRADAEGKLKQYCNISNGHNTIGVNVLDSLIDDEDAHSIMRDFRFDKNSRVTISDISAKVEYDNGISVNSFCRADIRNSDFLIGAIQDTKDANGNITGEKLRTDMGANPYSRVVNATCDVIVDVQMDKKNPDGSPLPEKLRITLNSPYLKYDNRPWLQKHNIRKGAVSSIISGDSIVFDLDNNGIILNNLKGKAYPAYAFGMFFAPLQEFMKDIRLQNPVNVLTKRCEFPISKRSQVPIRGLIRAEAPTGASFNFLGTSIPLHRFTGFVNLSDDFVFLDKMNARTWGGVLNGAIKIGISGKNTSFDGQLTAQNLNLKSIGDAYKTKLSPALCNAAIRFRSPTAEVKDVQAYGSATIRDGNLMELGIFQPVGSLISDLPGQLANLQRKVTGSAPTPAEKDKPGMISRFLSAFTNTTNSAINKMDASSRHIPFANHFMSYNIQNAELKFDILNGYLYTRDMRASGYNLDVDVNLRLNLETLDIRGNLWPQISSVPTLIIAPITFLSDFLIDIVIYGSADDIRWKFTLDKIMKKGRKKKKPSVTAAEETPKR